MKVWMDADVEVLSLTVTEHGNLYSDNFDGIYKDEDGNLWPDLGSGSDGPAPGTTK